MAQLQNMKSFIPPIIHWQNDGSVLMPTRSIEQRRSFTYNDVAVLAKEEERNLILREMREEASQQILRAISTSKVPS